MSGMTRSARQNGHALRSRLLRGSSIAALATAIGLSSAAAQSLSQLRAAVGINNQITNQLLKNPNINQSAAEAAGMSEATARALHYQGQVAQALALAQQAQIAARQAVLGSPGNVPNGLVIGGLQEVPNAVQASQDPTGLATWQGADQPTEKASGNKVVVTIQQTQQRAILSWESFNVGQYTTVDFEQVFNGIAEKSWVVLNRIVGTSTSPAEILGSINAQGTVLVLDQNGVLFGGASQVNVNALIASALEIGHAVDFTSQTPLSIKDRNDYFLEYGLMGYADQASSEELPSAYTFSAIAYCTELTGQCNGTGDDIAYTIPPGEIMVDAGANIQTDTGGYVLMTGPKIINSSQITSPEGQVSLEAGYLVTLDRSSGAAGTATPDIRGFSLTSSDNQTTMNLPDDVFYVENTAGAVISSPQGYVSLMSNDEGGVINDGVLEATTSVSRNGFIQLDAGDIQLGAGSTLAIGPDSTAETIPQDPVSILNFKPSTIAIGGDHSRVEVQSDAMIYAPSGNVTIGVNPGADTVNDGEVGGEGLSRVFIDSGAVIDVAGLPNVFVPATINSIEIRPVTQNDLQNDPNLYKDGFLDGETIYVDPRRSGVRSDGVAWVGSPLIPAESYYQQVGISVEQLMTKGGNVSLGAASATPGDNPYLAGDVTIKTGAVIDMDGGWVTYGAGWVQTSELIDASGNIVNVADANPDDVYIGVYNGFTSVQPRWGVVQNFADPLLLGRQYEPSYTEGRDAGSLTLKSSVIVLDGTVYAHAFPGPAQLADAQQGTAKSTIYGDARLLQGAPSQLPNGGFLFIQALANDPDNTNGFDGGGDINIVDGQNYQAVPGNLQYGQSISVGPDGNLVIPTRDPSSYLPLDRIDSIMLNADALSNMGLSDLALATSGEINVEKGADINLGAGGAFTAEAGRTITIDGKISVPSGTINLQTISLIGSGDTTQGGSVFIPEQAQLGSYDVVINGTLSVRGLWTNDFGAAPGQLLGDAYMNGGSITLNAAPSVLLYGENSSEEVNEDISGSILINQGALLDLSSGGYVSETGVVNLSGRGGNLSLIDETNFFQTSNTGSSGNFAQSAIPGFRVTTNEYGFIPSNPSQINSRVSIDGTILDYGFAGGGTFTLYTPEISFGDGTASAGTELSLDFFSHTGFANYDITTYETDLIANQFTNGLGGYNAILETDVLTIGAGQTLDLTQSYLALDLDNPLVAAEQMDALRQLATGGDIYSIIQPNIPTDAWDRMAVNLTLGGLIDLDVAKGGTLLDEAGGLLQVSQLDNQGTIRIPGGTINQIEMLPVIFGSSSGLGVHSLADVFSMNADGTINESGYNTAGIMCGTELCTNAQVASNYDIYLLGTMNPGQFVLGSVAYGDGGGTGANNAQGGIEGVHLGTGSVTDLSGISIRDPRAVAPGVKNFVSGRILSGGTLESQPIYYGNTPLFEQTIGDGVYGLQNINANDPDAETMPDQIVADPGSVLNLSGASDVYDEYGVGGMYTPMRVWSNAGTLDLANGGTITGAAILAQGGAPDALGGTIEMLDPVFYQNDPSTPTLDAISEEQIAASGFASFVALGSINSAGNATVSLSRGFFLESLPYDGQTSPDNNNDYYVAKVNSGGDLTIEAPYIGLDSIAQGIQNPSQGLVDQNSVTFKADNIDIIGAVEFENTVADVTLDASGDVRLIGVQPPDVTLGIQNGNNTSATLLGQLAVDGNLTIDAAEVYPTTGSTFYITSSASDGTITFGRTTETTPPTPYSAGADLTIQAASIVLGGDIQVPLGTLSIGGDGALSLTTNGTATQFAPATASVEALAGSITSVSAGGLAIPYGTTTDQTEWYFSPSNSGQLSAPPAAILNFGGDSVKLDSGAMVDLSGGGDVYAYEFIPGIGGSRDVLDRFNSDEFSSDSGYQYPGGTQVYAIVPGLSSGGVAAYDPLYSANYGDLYSVANAGQSVYLTGMPGLAAGWYTLLPAQYAMLPGGMRIVADMSAGAIAPGTSERMTDGTYLVSGYFGVAGTDTRSATPDAFEVQSQNTFLQYSQIALTSGDQYFAQLAAKNGNIAPRLPIDAGRLVLAPLEDLVVDTTLDTTPGAGGRGSEVDISGSAFDIVSTLPEQPQQGVIDLTATSLTNLDASSLLIGGVRTDNANGTTSIDVTATSITVANDAANPLTAPEILLAVNGTGSSITLDNGATIIATGNAGNSLTGNYEIDGDNGGALVRVAVGPQRLVTRPNVEDNAELIVGDVNLEGNSVLLDSSYNLTVASDATIEANALALGAGQVTFTSNGNGLSGLVITPQLQALFGKANELTILTPDTIAFAAGTYDFGNVTFDTPGLSLMSGDAVTIDANVLTFTDGNGSTGACGSTGAPECGHGKLTVDANQIDFGSGTLDTYGFGGDITLAASQGMYMVGNGTFNFGPATLDLETPYLGDLGSNPPFGINAVIPSLTLTTTGAVDITDPTHAKAQGVVGTPGASLTIDGRSIFVEGTELRATAGTLTLDSRTGIQITGDAILETPGYAKPFGDSADSVNVAAPGGTLSLIAQDGNIDADAGTLLSVGGDEGTAGTLSLAVDHGSLNLNGTIDARTPNGGGSLDLDTSGYFDLASFATGWAKDFTGTIDITSGAGNLDLLAGEELNAQNILLDANGGLVDIAGTIDVSGINGGTVNIYGLSGVTLESSAVIDAEAYGYGRMDPRQASGGTVNIGTDGTGVIDVKSGAVIDVAALQSKARLIPITLNGTVYYFYVPADVGGTVNFRLPVVEDGGNETVNMSYAGSIEGASAIDLVGFERWNLQNIANDANFVGVTINGQGQAVINVGAQAGSGQSNFFTDDESGTLVNFIQNFNISADNGNLGNLTSMANFHERPGVELDYSGDIVLQSNWNLGAGVVNIAGAVAAGLMLPVDPTCTSDCQYYVVPGDESEIFAKYTTLTYRVGGSVLGEPAVLTMRAGGNLDIGTPDNPASITDGFFQFGDQTDQNYLNVALGGGNRYYIPYLIVQCEASGNPGSCNGLGNWATGALANEYVDLSIPKNFNTQSFVFNPAPYNAAANDPTADGTSGTDELGSMQVFPLVKTAHGWEYVQSTSYQLVAGADLTGAGGNPSVNPLQTVPGSNDNVVVQGISQYTYGGSAGTSSWQDQLDFQVGNQYLTANAWYMDFLTTNPQASANSYTYIDFSKAPSQVIGLIDELDQGFLTEYSGDYQAFSKDGTVDALSMPLSLADQFMLDVITPATNLTQILSYYTPPRSKAIPKCGTQGNYYTCTATYMTLVRTGTGSIDIAASGDINLENNLADGQTPYETLEGQLTDGEQPDSFQLGGSPVYTAGHLADLTAVTVVDELTGQTFTVDPTNFDDTTDIFSQPISGGYQYGAQGNGSGDAGFAGIMIANPVYLAGGGNITLTAGNDVLSRRDIWGEDRLADNFQNGAIYYNWIGSSDQAWRVGSVGDITNIMLNPQLFSEGVGALGGGNITISAGHDVVDLTVADDTSVTTAGISSAALLTPTLGIWQFGGGNVSISAGNDILGGRIDVGEGSATITAGGDIAGDGTFQWAYQTGTDYYFDDAMRLRVTDATVDVMSGGDLTLAGIGALGVQDDPAAFQNNLDAHGFYTDIAGVSIVADGSITIENQTSEVTQGYLFDRSIVTGTSASDPSTDSFPSAVYPGSLEAAALTGTLDITGTPNPNLSGVLQADEVVLYPSAVGQLNLYAGADIMPVTIDMEDGDPGLLPGIFSVFTTDPNNGDVMTGRTFAFPGTLPNTTQAERESFHNSTPTHLGDPYPVRIDAGGDILDMIISVPKQARIWAGRDIINMMFFGQNLLPTDITRIVAGRDITATTELVAPYEYNSTTGTYYYGTPEPALQGNGFVIGGPGSFFLEAGRDAGPFLNSADTSGLEITANGIVSTGAQSWGGGILSVGNDWNPWLAPVGASLYVMFGIGKGADYDALRDYYLDPSNLPNLPGYLFQQVTGPSGNQEPDRSEPIYAPILIQWMQKNARSQLIQAYGTTKVSIQQAYNVFVTLPELQQQIFLLDNVYFNELSQTSVPTGASYENYSRGYIAINLLFPASLGYTQNNLGGGSNGANQLVETGDLDLRLSAIETTWGGNIYILGPGGRALIGSTVATAAQAALRTYAGGQLFAGIPITTNEYEQDVLGNEYNVPEPSTITEIPAGYEGVLTLRGGSIYTFTDEDFLLNQSRLFTEDGGDIIMWSSNGDLNAGQGPKTSSDFPPIVVETDEDLYSFVDSAGGVTGAGIAAFQPGPGIPAPDVFLIAPRGTVDAGAAGVRVAGNLFVAAFSVANASNFQVSGTTVGVPGSAAVNVAAQTGASSSAAAASQAAQAASAAANGTGNDESIITVDVMGYAEGDNSSDEEMRKRKRQNP